MTSERIIRRIRSAIILLIEPSSAAGRRFMDRA
jgi:hypothetical protein